MKQLYLISLILILIFTNACTSFLIVNSDPGRSDVFYMNTKTSEKKELGQTPLKLTNEEFNKKIGEELKPNEFYTIIVEKPGFASQTFSVPANRFGTIVTLLDVKLKEGKADNEKNIAKEILDHIFLAQRLALNQQFERAHIEVDKVLKDFPDFAKALSMRASIYYVQKNYYESVKWYEEALRVDPQMEDAVKMLAKVKDLLNGTRQPADATETKKGGTP